ncbi:MAG: ribbon-helix-helix protein, CopG family [Cyanobacteria bacterium J06635_1]
MSKAVASKVWATVSDRLAKKLEQRADEEGRSRSDLISYLLERVMEDWQSDSEDDGKVSSESQDDRND